MKILDPPLINEIRNVTRVNKHVLNLKKNYVGYMNFYELAIINQRYTGA